MLNPAAPVQRLTAIATPEAATNGVVQLMRPHITDRGRDFQIHYPRPDSSVIIGQYAGPGENDQYQFDTNRFGRIAVTEDRILGYRPVVGGMHPPGRVRPPEQNLGGRDQVFLSEADLSGAMARQRRDPDLRDRMVVTTFEDRPDYENYEQNRRDLESQGIPLLHGMDISRTEDTAERLSGVAVNANLHFQMPRVPRVAGYSTPRLIHDTLSLPGSMNRNDVSVSVTAPHPDSYSHSGTHNRLYGLESGASVRDTEMEMQDAASDSDADLEDYGYVHKQSTKDESAAVASKRKKYKFVPRQAEHEDFHDRPPRSPDPDDDSGGGMDMGMRDALTSY